MKSIAINRVCGFLVLLVSLSFFAPYPGVLKGAEIPSFEDVINGKAQAPTIEDLTGGKVKIGHLIDKNNMAMVKEYLGAGVSECLKQGLVMEMTKLAAPDELVPSYFRELTDKNNGKAIIDENGTVYYETMGTDWPGGVPFVNPKNGLEVMASVKYGEIYDASRNYPGDLVFVNKDGRPYKSVGTDHTYVYCCQRKLVPPLGRVSGTEGILWKRLSVITHPREVKGLGQYTVRHYDDAKNYDTGFAYIPAFKRTVRTSTTTWQDNVAGSDLTYGDGGGIFDPFSRWSFKSMGFRYVLLPDPKRAYHLLSDKGEINENVKFDVGKKFARLGWCIWPVHVAEATPKIKHIYSKKILYAHVWPYWPAKWDNGMADMYDSQNKLWKVLYTTRDTYEFDGEPYITTVGGPVHDLQTGHSTWSWFVEKPLKLQPKDINLGKLLKYGR